jgi:5-methylthioribose kinase
MSHYSHNGVCQECKRQERREQLKQKIVLIIATHDLELSNRWQTAERIMKEIEKE